MNTSNFRSFLVIALIAATPSALLAQGGASPAAEAYQSSYELEARGSLEASLAALQKVPDRQRGTYTYKLRNAWLHYLTGRHDAAIGLYREAIALAPGAVEPRLGLMLPQIALRRWLDVEKGAREVLKKDPGSYLATSRLAYALYNLGRYAEAERVYRQVLVGYPSDVEMRAGLGWSLLQVGQREAALGAFEQVLGVAPRHASATAGRRAAAAR